MPPSKSEREYNLLIVSDEDRVFSGSTELKPMERLEDLAKAVSGCRGAGGAEKTIDDEKTDEIFPELFCFGGELLSFNTIPVLICWGLVEALVSTPFAAILFRFVLIPLKG